MKTVVVTGSGGLIGAECVAHFVEAGYRVLGIENDMRGWFFGSDASTAHETKRLLETYEEFTSLELDIRDRSGVEELIRVNASELDLVIHAAAQPSHDWAAS